MNRNVTLIVAAGLVALTACVNQTTAEGHEGYIVHRPLVFGPSTYVGSQIGPTSTGLVWRQYVTNIDIRPKTYPEEFHILSRDNLNVGFAAHLRVSLRSGSAQQLVEELGAGTDDGLRMQNNEETAPDWYVRNVRQPCRTAVRDIVRGFDAYDIQSRTQEIGTTILARLQEEWADSPVVFEAISIGNLTYPEEINAEIQRKLAAEQDLDRMDRERQIAEQEARIAVTNARGRAAAQRIVNETLTPLYVQHEMLTQFQRLSRTGRATFVVSPTSDSGGSPVIMQLGN